MCLFIYMLRETEVLILLNVTVAGILSFPCCTVSTTVGKGQCVPNQPPCVTRALRAFWDGFHPTETGHLLIAGRAYNALSSLDAYPIDIHRLALL